jgi:hypothetical protein
MNDLGARLIVGVAKKEAKIVNTVKFSFQRTRLVY